MLRVAIVGNGVIAPIHMNFVLNRDNTKLVAMADIDSHKLIEVPRETAVYTDFIKMLDEVKPDIVHSCTPHDVHYQVAEACLERGIHIISEKPMTESYHSAMALTTLAESYPAKLGICLQNRYNPSSREMIEIVRNERYGKLIGIRGAVNWFRPLEYYHQAKWRGSLLHAGSGAILNQAIHTLDLMTCLKQDIPMSVRASFAQLNDYELEVEDTASASFIYEDGMRSNFQATVSNFANEPIEISIYMEKAELLLRGTTLYLREGTQYKVLVEDTLRDGQKFYYGAGHQLCLEAFYQAVINNTNDYIHAQDGLLAMRLFEAMRLSANANNQTIDARVL